MLCCTLPGVCHRVFGGFFSNATCSCRVLLAVKQRCCCCLVEERERERQRYTCAHTECGLHDQLMQSFCTAVDWLRRDVEVGHVLVVCRGARVCQRGGLQDCAKVAAVATAAAVGCWSKHDQACVLAIIITPVRICVCACVWWRFP